MTTIAIIDYGIGNIQSIVNSLIAVGATPIVTRDSADILSAQGIILPGVGAFGEGMANLRKYQLIPIIFEAVRKEKSILGICLGMQLLFQESEEFGHHLGLGLIEGCVKKLPSQPGEKLPHVSWNQLYPPTSERWAHSIFQESVPGIDMYFVHSFAAYPHHKADILSETPYGDTFFCSSVQRGTILGCQFHPEKSGPAGLTVLRNFVQIVTLRN